MPAARTKKHNHCHVPTEPSVQARARNERYKVCRRARALRRRRPGVARPSSPNYVECCIKGLTAGKLGLDRPALPLMLRLGVTLKSVTLGNVTMSHRTRERPAECLASLSHSTMIGLPRAALEN
ncbi:hypothetical protein EVAR_20507_1 [Eumeta japonica]|uniref:Uncharacterized protein n=1 Tax=Eumeta variegata TaxID=151549 RepID=A0A4C1VL93_EUMVA|nr:hypothetical protein EVAR_20507_1 [Eumeta japonica]